MKRKNELNNIKFSAFYIVVAVLSFLVIGLRASQLALSEEIDGINLQTFAANRTTKSETLQASRGTIYDYNGNALAQNVTSYTLIAYLDSSRTTNPDNPMHVVDKEETAKKLATVINLSEDKILNFLNREGIYQTEFGSKGRGLTELTKDAILALELPGIDFIETQKRHYPYGNFLSYAIGYAKLTTIEDENGNSEEQLIGEMGIEKYCNNDLTGTNGYTLYQKDRNGYKIAGTQEVTVDATDGNDVYLTVDSNVQLFVEHALTDMMDSYSKFEWVTVMLADAKTGAILASATTPSFDPNKKDITNYLDYNISYPYEPGSTMKIFSYMAAMEAGVYDGSEKYKSGTYVTKDGTEIGDWDRSGWGKITYDAGFALSSNVAVVHLINKYMSAEILRDYYAKLGFGQKTGIELPNEVSGKLAFKYETEVLNAGFGQGITTTPVQNIKALTSISNNGILLKPYIIDKIVDESGNVIYQGGKTELGRVASEKTVSKIKELMASVINGNSSNSTGYGYYMKGYDFIAKTGTAQVAKENGQGYKSGVVIRGVAGMFPGEDPEVIIYLAAKDKGKSGVKYMRVAVKEIIKNVSKYLNIYDESKSEVAELDEMVISSYISQDVDVIKASLESKNMNVVILGDGDKVIKQYPNSGTVVNELDTVFLLTNLNELKMPDIVGYSSKDLFIILKLLDIPYKVNGNGYVSKQSIEAGTVLQKDMLLEIELSLQKPKKESNK